MATNAEAPILGLSLRCDRRAPRLARCALERALDAAPVLDDAMLVASELVNRAVLRSGCATDAIIRVAAHMDGGFLVISVHEPDIALPIPAPIQPNDDPEPIGLGWRVVQHLARRWGIERHDGNRVWAALPIGG